MEAPHIAAAAAAAAAVAFGCCLLRPSPAAAPPVVSEVYVYPVKSTEENSVQSARVTAAGFAGDRVFQVVSATGNSEGCPKPWAAGRFLTPRDEGCEKLFHVRAELGRAGDGSSQLTLTSRHVPGNIRFVLDLQNCATTPVDAEVLGVPRPNDNKEHLEDYGDSVAAWLDSAIGCPGGCRLVGIGGAELGLGDTFEVAQTAREVARSCAPYGREVAVNPSQNDGLPAGGGHPISLADEAPFLLTNAASLDDLNVRLASRNQAAVDMRRFRPNIVVSGGLRAWEEDSWKRIRISSADRKCAVEFYVWQRCGRCKMTTFDRDSLKRSYEPLATMNEFRERDGGERNFGMHLIPCDSAGVDACTALVHVGAKVEVLEYDVERRAEWERLFG